MNHAGPTPRMTFRAPLEDDVAYITNSWLESYRVPGAMVHRVSNDVYYTHHHRIIERLWHDPHVLRLVASAPEDTQFILGWMFAEATDVGPIVHYVYVRRPLRGLGVASALLTAIRTNADGSVADRGFLSHLTPQWEGLERGQDTPFRTVYSPYLCFKEFSFNG